MNTPLLLDNLFTWSVQVVILVTAGSAASLALRHPRLRGPKIRSDIRILIQRRFRRLLGRSE